MSISLRLFFDTLIQIILLLSINEQLYAGGLSSGSFNHQLLRLYILIGFLMTVFSKRKILVIDILKAIFAILYVFYGGRGGYFAQFYSSMLLLVFLGSNITFKQSKLLFGGIIFQGFFYSIVQRVAGFERVPGFFSNTPTLFSIAMLMSMSYFLYSPNSSKKEKIVYPLLALIPIFWTGSRSTFYPAIILMFHSLVIVKFLETKRLNTHNKFISISMITTIFGMLGLTALMFFKLREGTEGSNISRKMLLDYFSRAVIENPVEYIFGKGAGYSSYMIPRLLPWIRSETYPLHQDLLLWIVEYGVVGVFILFFVLFFRRNIHGIVYILFFISTFHNLSISPILLIILVILNNQLTQEGIKNVQS